MPSNKSKAKKRPSPSSAGLGMSTLSSADMDHPSSTSEECLTDSNNNSDDIDPDILKKLKNYEKYSLRPRSIQNRIETEKRQKMEPKKQPKPKSKPPPLSKYRRKTANARERNRMKEINTAFDALQQVVPAYPVLPVNAQGKTCEKLTKITTLRLAMNYISALSNLLNNGDDPSDNEGSTSSSVVNSCGGSISSGGSNYADSSAGGVSSSVSEFSPASSYAMSPLSSCSPAGPDCIQTVMRSVVSPAAAAALSANAATLNNLSLNGQLSTSALSQIIIVPTPSPVTITSPLSALSKKAKQQQQQQQHLHHHHLHHHHHHLPPHSLSSSPVSSIVSMSPPASSPSSTCSSSSSSKTNPSHGQSSYNNFSPMSQLPHSQPPSIPLSMMMTSASYSSNKHFVTSTHHHHGTNKLPPIATSMSSALLRKSMSTFAADCIQLTSGLGYSTTPSSSMGGGYATNSNICTSSSNSNNSDGANRTGSLSSLTESDLSEYASDLLSDEGSTLDDPMFDDIIGVGVATDLELLLQQTDSDALAFG